jgi:hypothetical protein
LIRVFRATNPLAVDYMMENLGTEDLAAEDVGNALKNAMLQVPDHTFVLQAYEETTLKGFIVAYDQPGHPTVFLSKAWADLKLDRNIVDRMFLQLLQWTEDRGKTHIRAETTRKAEAFYRRWGFEYFSTMIDFDLSNGFENKIIERMTRKDNEDGTEQQGRESPDDSSVAGTTGPSARGVPGDTGGSGDDTLWGRTSSSDDPGASGPSGSVHGPEEVSDSTGPDDRPTVERGAFD